MKKILLFVIVGLLTVVFTVPVMAKVTYKPTDDQLLTLSGVMFWGSFYINENNRTEEDGSDFFFGIYGDPQIKLEYESGNFYGRLFHGLGNHYKQLYGTWTISEDLSLTIGKKPSPYTWGAYSVAANNGGTGYGILDVGSHFRLTIKYKEFYIDAAEPHTPELGLGLDDADYSKIMPRTSVGYDYSFEGLKIGGGLSYNTFKMKSASIGFDKTISSWVAFLHGDMDLSKMLKLRYAGWYGVNPEEYGVVGLNGPISGESDKNAVVVNNNVVDTKTFAGHIALHANIGEMVARVGYGYASSDNDTFAEADAHQEYWVNIKIPIIKEKYGVSMDVEPEIHVFDNMKDRDGNKETSVLYVGAKWKLYF